jgi:hypothetical protein
MGIKLPKGILNAYSPFLVNFASTPARFLCLADPLIPYGFIMRIFKAYGATKPFDSTDEKITDEMHAAASNSNEELVTDIHDEMDDLLTPESTKSLEAMYMKVKTSTDSPDWHSNLNSIEEKSPEELVSPLVFRSDSIFESDVMHDADNEDEEFLEMKISNRSAELSEK